MKKKLKNICKVLLPVVALSTATIDNKVFAESNTNLEIGLGVHCGVPSGELDVYFDKISFYGCIGGDMPVVKFYWLLGMGYYFSGNNKGSFYIKASSGNLIDGELEDKDYYGMTFTTGYRFVFGKNFSLNLGAGIGILFESMPKYYGLYKDQIGFAPDFYIGINFK